jgi:hypothetical protein
LLVALVWACWFNDTTKAARERLLLGFGAVLITAVLSRVLQVSLPVRLRPMHDLASGFLPLPGLDPHLHTTGVPFRATTRHCSSPWSP